MPIEMWYIIALIAVICILFLVIKRPIYECMFWGYALMVIVTGQAGNFFEYIIKTSTDTLFYAIIAFLVLAKILDATHAIDSVVNVIISIFGRLRGGRCIYSCHRKHFYGSLIRKRGRKRRHNRSLHHSGNDKIRCPCTSGSQHRKRLQHNGKYDSASRRHIDRPGLLQ